MPDIKFSGNCHTHSCVSEQVIRTDDRAVRIEQRLEPIERQNAEILKLLNELARSVRDLVERTGQDLDSARFCAALTKAVHPTPDESRDLRRLREDLDRARKACANAAAGSRP